MLSTGQAARRLGVSQEAVRQWVRLGKLGCIETPLGRLFHPGEVAGLARRRLAKLSVQDVARVEDSCGGMQE